jgi:hypothetical protein
MKLSQLGVKTLADDLAIPHDDGADQRVRADSPATALGKLQSAPQVRPVRGCELGIHPTD